MSAALDRLAKRVTAQNRNCSNCEYTPLVRAFDGLVGRMEKS